jgi:hypothetical protein
MVYSLGLDRSRYRGSRDGESRRAGIGVGVMT